MHLDHQSADEKQPPVRPKPDSAWMAPFLWAEWGLEWAEHGLSRLAVFSVFEYLLKIAALASLIFGAISYLLELPHQTAREIERGNQERKIKHYQAWQVINLAQGQSAEGGRKDAIEDLNHDDVDLQGLATEQANLNGIKLEGGRLRRARMAGADLQGAVLRKSKFRSTDLTNADLRGADLRDADLSDAILKNVDLGGAKLHRANLLGGSLTSANLKGAVLQGAQFDPTLIKKAKDWELAVYDPENREKLGLEATYLSGKNLSTADLRYADLSEQDLSNSELTGANIRGTKLRKAKLRNAKLGLVNRKVIISGDPANPVILVSDSTVPLSQAPSPAGSANASSPGLILQPSEHLGDNTITDLGEADLTGALLSSADLSDANLSHATLTKANLRDGIFTSTNFELADLQEADLRDARLAGANLRNAKLQKANLSNIAQRPKNWLAGETTLRGADLTSADLRGAILEDADLAGTSLEKAQFDGPEQVKKAKNWEQAHYSDDFRLLLNIVPEPIAVPLPEPASPQ